MPARYDEESVWDEFITKKGIQEEEENEFLEYLFDQDIDPELATQKILDDAYTQFVDEESE